MASIEYPLCAGMAGFRFWRCEGGGGTKGVESDSVGGPVMVSSLRSVNCKRTKFQEQRKGKAENLNAQTTTGKEF